ncbi:hypothetical protein KDD30_19810 (plasmid) [Photobacterium sp. GJ3]|nr:hypothetical protein [Photobacterium sp. GJ3]QUJ70360.1 hypothetical protein KDD30_19810 [Photobacterium sp. GJ3]
MAAINKQDICHESEYGEKEFNFFRLNEEKSGIERRTAFLSYSLQMND